MRNRPLYQIVLRLEGTSTVFERSSRVAALLPGRYGPPDYIRLTSGSGSPHIPDKVPVYELGYEMWSFGERPRYETYVYPLVTLDRAKAGQGVLILERVDKPIATAIKDGLVHVVNGVEGASAYSPCRDDFFLDRLQAGGKVTCPKCLEGASTGSTPP
jgi:hypothetical protein